MINITRRISAYNHSSGNDIKYLVIHDTGNYEDTASGNANYFCTGDRGSSAHYFIDSSSIFQIVEDYEASWHCGDGGMAYGIGNHNSIGIEMCKTAGVVADGTIVNTIDLVKMLMAKYNISIDRVVRHYDASRKNCPASMSANGWAKWNEFKARLSGASVPTAPTTSTISTSSVGFQYPNNAQVVGDFLYVRDVNGNIITGRQVDNGDKITVLDVLYTKQLALVQYPTPSGVRSGYVTNVTSIIKYFNPYNYANGSTPEIVYDKPNGVRIGSLNPYEKATRLFVTRDGWTCVVYNTDKGANTKSGFVRFKGL